MAGIGGTEKKLDNLHWPLLLSTVLICALGVWNLASATRNTAAPLWSAQLFAMLVGAIGIVLVMVFDYRWLSSFAWPGYVATLGLLVGVVYFGKKVLGARRWLRVGSLQLQPSEVLKVAIIVVLARWFSQDETGARQGHYRLRDLWAPALIVLFPVALVMA